MNAVKQFLAEYWLWILVPALLVGLGLVLLLAMGSEEGSSPYIYGLY